MHSVSDRQMLAWTRDAFESNQREDGRGVGKSRRVHDVIKREGSEPEGEGGGGGQGAAGKAGGLSLYHSIFIP